MITNLAEGQLGFTSNAFLVTGERTVVVDPGSNFDVVSAIRDRLDGEGDNEGADEGDGEAEDRLEAVVLTHTHPDHVGNVGDVVDAFGVDVWGCDPSLSFVDHAIADGDRVRLGDHQYLALHTPGHKDDHLCFFSREAGVLFAGDLVFANGGFGRTDLEEGDRATLVESINYVLDTVDEDLLEMYTGHGPSVTSNPRGHVELAARTARAG